MLYRYCMLPSCFFAWKWIEQNCQNQSFFFAVWDNEQFRCQTSIKPIKKRVPCWTHLLGTGYYPPLLRSPPYCLRPFLCSADWDEGLHTSANEETIHPRHFYDPQVQFCAALPVIKPGLLLWSVRYCANITMTVYWSSCWIYVFYLVCGSGISQGGSGHRQALYWNLHAQLPSHILFPFSGCQYPLLPYLIVYNVTIVTNIQIT